MSACVCFSMVAAQQAKVNGGDYVEQLNRTVRLIELLSPDVSWVVAGAPALTGASVHQ